MTLNGPPDDDLNQAFQVLAREYSRNERSGFREFLSSVLQADA